jgi:hypothetical protein
MTGRVSSPVPLRRLVAAGVLVLGTALTVSSGATTAVASTSSRPGVDRQAPARAAAREALRIARQVVSGRARSTDASMALLRLRLTMDALPLADRREAAAVLARPTDNPDVYGVTYTTKAKRRCSRHICLHWVPSGRDAPPGPGWVTRQLRMLDHVWRYEVHRLGYHHPRSDGARGGGGKGRFDVYLAELYRRGLYGLTVAERPTPHHRHHYSSYLVLDNDFVRRQYHARPMQIARVTAAHEFFHAIQYGYDVDEDPWFMEASSTWMEDQFDDSSNDNRQYLPWSQLAKPGTPLDTYSDTGFEQYGNWVFLEYLSERFGRRVVHRIWHRAAARPGGGQYSTAAIRSVLGHHGGLPSVFGRYASANTDPSSSYAEGRAYPTAGTVARSTLTRASPTVPWTTYAVQHLASVNVQASPGNGLDDRQWRLRVAVDGPDAATSPSVVVRVIRRDHRAAIVEVPLSPDGSGSATVPFDSGRVRHVTVTMANASTRFSCHTDGGYSCRGTPKDPRTSFAVRMSLLHS